MLNKIRTDITDVFKRADFLLVNTSIFSEGFEETLIFKNIWKMDFGNIVIDLNNLNKKIVFYNYDESKCSLVKQNYNLIKHNGHQVALKNEFDEKDYIAKKYIVVGFDIEDKYLMENSLFSIAPSNSALEIKMMSSYASNYADESAFIEVGNLMYNSSV